MSYSETELSMFSSLRKNILILKQNTMINSDREKERAWGKNICKDT